MSSTRGREILEYLRDQQQEIMNFLETIVKAESPSSIADSQKQVHGILATALQEQGLKTIPVRGRTSGGHLYARPQRRERQRPAQLLLGHYDTVWPLGTLQEMPFRKVDTVLKGPGIFDMKGGLTQIVFALKAINALGLDMALTPVVFMNSDEEIGSGESRRYIRLLARHVERAFVLEPSMGPTGKLKTARKGVGRYTVYVQGKAAHAGLDPEAGASAILELSFVIQKLFALNDPEKGVSVNVGTIDGGLQPNVIAPKSQAIIDVRVPTQEDAERIDTAIKSLKPSTPRVSLTIEGGIGRPAMEPTSRNQVLWRLAKNLGEEIDLELEHGMAGGGSDGNIASLYTATLDGLGAVGDGAHASHEFLYIDKSVERTALLTLLLLSPSVN